ncbi:RNA polymerase sigma factor [Micromonospora sp. NPDC047134]|uniref:RNA polymerase sigma factor n=1 Tax=Micromonospora sp. NPDC047134 TaxID=3154340 RepID=UPI0033E965D4
MRDRNTGDPDEIEATGQTGEDTLGDPAIVLRDVAAVVERVDIPPPLRAAWDGDGATIEQVLPAAPVPATDFDSFYLRHRPVLLRKMLKLCAQDKHLAEEITQGTLFIAYRVQDQLPEVDDHEAWLYRVASRTAWKVFRRQRMEGERLRTMAARPTPPGQPHDWTLLDDLLRRTLTNRQRQIIVYRFVEGQPRRWIADQLGVSLRTVDSEIRKSLDQLRPFLEPGREDN